MDYAHGLLALRAHNIYSSERSNDPFKRVIIALAGPPGSRKSTVAQDVVDRLNKHHHQPWAQVLPMYGFYYPQITFDMMPNRVEAYARRGAHWTFDTSKLIHFLHIPRSSRTDSATEILAPGFDHALKDPTPDAIKIGPQISLVILEGSWPLLDREPWDVIPTLCDGTWFIDVEPSLARTRIAKRHVRAGVEADMFQALIRADTNDMINGAEIRSRLVTPNFRVESVDTTTWNIPATHISTTSKLNSSTPKSVI